MPNPAHAIAEWLERQLSETQNDIAFRLLPVLTDMSLRELFDAERGTLVASLLSWLRTGSAHRAVGKAVSFRANFERDRHLTEEGWEETRDFFQRAMDEEPLLADSAKERLHKIPSDKARWLSIAADWNEFASDTLTEQRFQYFTIVESRKEPELPEVHGVSAGFPKADPRNVGDF